MGSMDGYVFTTYIMGDFNYKDINWQTWSLNKGIHRVKSLNS